MFPSPSRALADAAREHQEHYMAIQDMSQILGLEFETTRERFARIVADRPMMSWRRCYKMIVHDAAGLGVCGVME